MPDATMGCDRLKWPHRDGQKWPHPPTQLPAPKRPGHHHIADWYVLRWYRVVRGDRVYRVGRWELFAREYRAVYEWIPDTPPRGPDHDTAAAAGGDRSGSWAEEAGSTLPPPLQDFVASKPYGTVNWAAVGGWAARSAQRVPGCYQWGTFGAPMGAYHGFRFHPLWGTLLGSAGGAVGGCVFGATMPPGAPGPWG